ncbi:MAG TPA: hypothetical protein DIU07_02790 [Rhodobacteraceae bacterium]|nr:hypothetical protein [Paracoccaceae bacterium]
MMAEAPKSTKTDKAADPKAKTSDTPGTAPKDAKGPVEEAVVIGETPPKAAKASASEAKASAKDAPKDPKPAAPAKPASEPAKPKSTAKTVPPPKSAAKSSEPPKPAPAETKPAKAGHPQAEQPAKRRGGFGAFLGLLLGGVAAAIIGFVAARTVVPEGWPFPGVDPQEDPLIGVVEAQGAEIAALGERLGALDATLEEVKSDTSALDALRESVTTRLDGLESGAGEIAEQLGTMETRLSSVEKLAPEGTEAAEKAAQAYSKELAALREMFEGELAEIDAAQAEASALEAQLADSAKAAAGRTALAQVQAALDTGAPFEDALLELTEATGLDAPAALSAVAAEGVSALAELQSGFPAAARAAIEADIRTGVEEGNVNRLQAFLKTQLGTRSLEPKEGDSADAVLSRAEAALKTGDLDAVLAEIETLPEAAKPAFADWQTLAESRAQALTAGTALAEELNAK